MGKTNLLFIFTVMAGLVLFQTTAADQLVIPREHPRVYVRQMDIAGIQAKISANIEPFKSCWSYIQGSNHPLCLAFRYLITGDTIAGRQAITQGLVNLQDWHAIHESIDDNCGRRENRPNHYCACVYDWCYPLLTAQQKQDYIREFIEIDSVHRPYYPAQPEAGYFVSSHDMEGWILTGQLPHGVAIYDENQILYRAAETAFFSKMLPCYNFHYPSHMHHQGDSYIHRFVYDMYASWLFKGLGYPHVFSTDQQYVPYQLVYNLRPDLLEMRSGDGFIAQATGESLYGWIFMLTSVYYRDPYLFNMMSAIKYTPTIDANYALAPVFYLITMPLDMVSQALTGLPKSKYFPSPMGEIVARTGWDISPKSTDAIVQMRIGEYHFYGHQRKDFGTFQIFYKGVLAPATGMYDEYQTTHFLHYQHQTISQNGLLIFDPNEQQNWQGKWPLANDGGEISPFNNRPAPKNVQEVQAHPIGRVNAHAIGPNPITPAYNYLAGDITEAYTNKVSTVTRSMVTFNRFNATCPLVFMVFDRVTSTNASFKKTWLLHSLEEPGIAARRMTIVNNRPRYDKNGNLDTTKGRYSGKLVVDCLLPRQAVIRKVGGPGKEFWIESAATNYTMSDTPAAAFEVGAWRLEVSPEAPVLADQFLHAMAVMDKDTALLETSALLDCGTMVGAALLGKAVLFSKDGLLRDSVWFDLGVRPYDVLLVDLTPGLWKIQAGQNKNIYTVNDTARCLYLPDCRGAYTLQAGTTSIAPVPDGQSEGIAVSCLRNRIMAVTVRVREPQMVRLTLYGVDGKQMARPLVRKLNNRTTLVHYPYFGVAGVYVLECRGASFSVHRKFLLTPQ